jgi:hypothetical protein
MKPTKTELMMKLARLAAAGGAPIPKPDNTPRWKDGTPKDPLLRLEEQIDLERLLGVPVYDESGVIIARENPDSEYQDQHMREWGEWIRLTAQREAEGRRAEMRQVEIDRTEAGEAYEESLREAESKSKQDAEAQFAEAVDLYYATGGKSPLPKR